MLKQLFQNYKFLLGVNFSAESAGNSEGELKEDAQKLSLDLTKRFLKEMGDNIDGSSLQAVKGINDNFEEASQYFQKISKNDRNTLEKMIETEYAESLCDGITIKDADSLKVFKRLLERIHPEFDAEFLALDKLATAVGKMKSVAGDKILLTYEDGAVTLYTSVKNEINGLVDHQDKKVVSYSSAGDVTKTKGNTWNRRGNDDEFDGSDVSEYIENGEEEAAKREKKEAKVIADAQKKAEAEANKPSPEKQERITQLTEKLNKAVTIDNQNDFNEFVAAVQTIDTKFVDISTRYEDIKRVLLNQKGEKEFTVSYQLGEVRVFEPLKGANKGVNNHTLTISSQGELKKAGFSLDYDLTGNNEKITGEIDYLSNKEELAVRAEVKKAESKEAKILSDGYRFEIENGEVITEALGGVMNYATLTVSEDTVSELRLADAETVDKGLFRLLENASDEYNWPEGMDISFEGGVLSITIPNKIVGRITVENLKTKNIHGSEDLNESILGLVNYLQERAKNISAKPNEASEQDESVYNRAKSIYERFTGEDKLGKHYKIFIEDTFGINTDSSGREIFEKIISSQADGKKDGFIGPNTLKGLLKEGGDDVADSMSPKRLKISEDYATRLIQSFSKEEDKAQYIAELGLPTGLNNNKQIFTAIIAYQLRNNLTPDGIAGDEVRGVAIQKIGDKIHDVAGVDTSGAQELVNKMIAFQEGVGKIPGVKIGPNCGRNVRAALKEIGGITSIPESGMHGYVYAQFLADNPREFGVVEGITDMAQVKTGGILVYDRAPGLEDMTEAQALAEGYSKRDFYGHVEIAQGSGNYFWGTTKNSPGGSVDASKDPDAARFIGKVYYPKVEIA